MPTGIKPDPPNNSARVAFEGSYLGTTWAVVHWFLLGASVPITVADLDLWTLDIRADFLANLFGPAASPNCHYNVTRTTLFLPASQKRRRVHVADAVGSAAGVDLPAQVSILVDWETIDGRRGGKPRSYMPGVTAGNVDESYQVKASQLSVLNADVASYVAAVNARVVGTITSTEFVEMSFVTGGAYRGSAVSFAVESGYVRPVLATQRRRVDRQAA